MFDILEERLKKMDVKYFKLTEETFINKLSKQEIMSLFE